MGFRGKPPPTKGGQRPGASKYMASFERDLTSDFDEDDVDVDDDNDDDDDIHHYLASMKNKRAASKEADSGSDSENRDPHGLAGKRENKFLKKKTTTTTIATNEGVAGDGASERGKGSFVASSSASSPVKTATAIKKPATAWEMKLSALDAKWKKKTPTTAKNDDDDDASSDFSMTPDSSIVEQMNQLKKPIPMTTSKGKTKTTTMTTTTTPETTKGMTSSPRKEETTTTTTKKSFLKKTASFDDISVLPRNTSIEDVRRKSGVGVVEEEEEDEEEGFNQDGAGRRGGQTTDTDSYRRGTLDLKKKSLG